MRKKDKKKKLERSRQHAAQFTKNKKMRAKSSYADRSRSTFADALDVATTKNLLDLKATLVRAAALAVEKQQQQSMPPWDRYEVRKTTPKPSHEPVKRQAVPTKTAEKKASPDDRGYRNKITPRVYHKPKEPEKIKHYPSIPRVVEKERPFEFWVLPSGAAVREKPPSSASQDSIQEFSRLLGLGVSGENTGEPIFATIGLDFGTSSTKAIIRLPFEAGEPTYAISMPSFCLSDGNPHLWKTVIWQDDKGNFYPYPVHGSKALQTLKQDLMHNKEEQEKSSARASEQEANPVEAATAYLTFAIKYVRGCALKDFPSVFRGRVPIWFVNVGLATAGYDDRDILSTYRRAASAALLLSSSKEEISIFSVRSYLNNPTVIDAGKSSEKSEELGIAVIPETAAEATGFTKTVAAAPGLFTMIDVGAMTLDVCTFGLINDSPNGDELPLFRADVKPLGVEAYHWFMQDGRDEADFIKQCNLMLWNVIWTTKTKRHRSADCWKRGNDLPVFLTGGGARNLLHRELVDNLGPWLSHNSSNDGIRVLSLEPPSTIQTTVKIEDFGRLTVAWGLSYPPTEIGKPIPPSAITDDEKGQALDFSGQYISKDQV